MFLFADLVWPAMFLEARILTLWDIALGLAIEAGFIYYIYRANLRDTVLMTLTVNALSTLIGIILIPVLGIIWEFFPGMVLYKVFHVGTFNPGTWSATFLLATGANTVIESWALKHIFKKHVTKRVFWLMFVANAISVGLALASLFIWPQHS